LLIAVFSIGQTTTQKIIQIGLTNSLPEYEITNSIFVDKNSSESKELGTPLKPFKTISQGLDFIKQNQGVENIYIKPGQYQGIIEIPTGVNLLAHQSETFITNNSLDEKTLLLNGNNTINGLTVQGGRYAIFIPEEAKKIIIKNSKIENASWYGVYNKKHPEINEEYSLTIENSEISGNYRQGLYLQKGIFVMTNSKALNNGEEGVDLHADMTSIIRNSEISNNGEGGIETELENINLTVEDSLIENNGSSGINLQSAGDNSYVKISGNKINKNSDFGIRCALHSKISRPYFTKAFETYPSKINTFSSNGKTPIDPNCWAY